MKTSLLIILLIVTTHSYAQEKSKLYHLKIDGAGKVINKPQIDSTISVLKRRLLIAGYKNSTVVFNDNEKEFIVENESNIEDEFISNWLLKPCKISFYEMYTAVELLDVLLAYPNHDKDLDKKKSFYTLLNISDSTINDRKATNVGVIKVSDTTEFAAIAKTLKNYIPKDCLFAYEQNQPLEKKSFLKTFALRNNNWELPLSGNLDSIKMTEGRRKEPSLSIRFNVTGTKKFAKLTQKNTGKAIVIVIDGVVYSAPYVYGEIEGGKTEISGLFAERDTKLLADMIAGGYLPISLIK